MSEPTNHTTDTPPAPEVFASMRQAAGAKGVSVSVLKAAKGKGCPGFHQSGRITWQLVQPWLETHADEITQGQDEDKDFWALQKLKFDAKRSELAYEHDKGLYLTKEEVAAQLTQLSSAAKSVLKTRLEDELPAKLVGLDAIAIREAMSRAVDDVCRIIQGDTWL